MSIETPGARRFSHFPFFHTVKSKLLLAFCLIVGLSVVIGSIGWSGFSDSEKALNSLQNESLPNIDRAMELARRSSAVAAIAPFLSSIQVVNKLNAENAKLDAQLSELRTLVDAIEPLAPGQQSPIGSLHDLAERLEGDLKRLVRNTHDSLDIRSDMLELAYAFEQRDRVEAALKASAVAPETASARIETFRKLAEAVYSAIGSDDPAQINRLETKFQALAATLGPLKDDGIVQDQAGLAAFIRTQSLVFDTRRRAIDVHQTTQYLLSSIHALSKQLGDSVADLAGRTSQSVKVQSAQTNETLDKGKNRILLLTLSSVLASSIAAFYVLRNLAGNLQTIANAISRLAGGDRATYVPAVERADEIGILARAFNVFKEQSFDREALANDLIAKSRVLEATFANMADGLSVFDAQGGLTAWNLQFIEILELDGGQIAIGARFHDIIERMLMAKVVMDPVADAQTHPARMFAIRRADAVRCEWSFPGGRVVELRSQPMDGGFAMICTDVTERRSIDRKLRQAQHMEAVGQLTSGVAHDFNNLLAAVSGNLQMLHESLRDRQDLTPRILRALDAAERGATLTQRLLAFSRQQALQPEMTNLNGLIRNLIDLLDCSLAGNIRIETDLQADLDEVFVDPGQLEHAILNLVFNSRDAMPEGGHILITTMSAPPTDPTAVEGIVRITVEDDGVGMSQEVVSRAYEPFFTTKEQGRGSGLGLSMVFGFVTQSGGQVDITSNPGQGTRVAIALPLRRGISANGRRRTTVPADAAMTGHKESILVVEDDRLVRDTTVDMLQSLGYATVAVANIDDAKRALDQIRFDLLFTDFILSDGWTGDDVAAYALQSDARIAVLYTSGYPHNKLQAGLGPRGAINLIAKPYSKAMLAAAIARLLVDRRPGPAARPPH